MPKASIATSVVTRMLARPGKDLCECTAIRPRSGTWLGFYRTALRCWALSGGAQSPCCETASAASSASTSSSAVARVAVEDVPQVRDLVVGVDLLGRLGAGVPEDVLDLGELGAAIEHHAGLGVAEIVGGGVDADRRGVPLDDVPDALRREAPASAAGAGLLAAPEVVAQEQRRRGGPRGPPGRRGSRRAPGRRRRRRAPCCPCR